MKLSLQVTLLSDSTFGRGDGVPGVVDVEVEHDAATGLPLIRGTSLKGLLVAECANLLWTAEQANPELGAAWATAAGWLFGSPGSGASSAANLRLGPAVLPAALQAAVRADLAQDSHRRTFQSPAEVLGTLTTIRRQTSLTAVGAPQRGSLRNLRAVLRGTTFEADLELPAAGRPEWALPVLAGCVVAARRGGLGRNRGRGRLALALACEAAPEQPAAALQRLLAALEGAPA
ncbi:MAG: hypothetical protein IT204_15305 [Fimbriimonadaceae bacterium]|nr:hypothetical protein [Fimbriimonadaceae bacterium]